MADEPPSGDKKNLTDFEARILMAVLSLHSTVASVHNDMLSMKYYLGKALLSKTDEEMRSYIVELLGREDVEFYETKQIIDSILENYEI